jgi:hypothetical protein
MTRSQWATLIGETVLISMGLTVPIMLFLVSFIR